MQLLGFTLFIIAIVVLVRTTTTKDAFDLHKYLVGYLVVSIIILVVAFLGCCGAIRESRCMLIMVGAYVVLTMSTVGSALNIQLVRLIEILYPKLRLYINLMFQACDSPWIVSILIWFPWFWFFCDQRFLGI